MSVRTQSAHTEAPDAVEAPSDASAHSPHTQPLNAYQRMIVAQRVIDSMPFAKTQKNSEFQSVPIDAMRAAVRRACIDAGLVHRLEGIEYTVGTNGKGTTMMWTGRARLLFVSADDPSDFVAYECLGCAMDNGDKGISKFETNLLKNGYKEAFDLGERGKDDIDAYANEDIEAEAERIEAIRERREANRRKASEDPFFGKASEDPLSALRRQIGPLMTDHADVVQRYKSEHGPVPSWSEDVLRACIAEAKGGEQ